MAVRSNLLRFVSKVDPEFRVLVEIIGSTVFLTRRENSLTQTILNIYGFGRMFLEAYNMAS